MSQISIYNPGNVPKHKPRQHDYNKIYEMVDRGEKGLHIQKHLGISYGTLQHALRVRKKERENEHLQSKG